MQRKIFLAFFLIIVIPSLVLLLVAYNLYVSFYTDNTLFYTRKISEEIIKNIDIKLKNYAQLTMQIYYNQDIIDSIEKASKARPDRAQENIDNSSSKEVLQSIVNSDRFLSSAYLLSHSAVLVEGQQYVDILNYIKNQEPELAKEPGRLYWVPTHQLQSVFGDKYFCFGAVRQIRKNNIVIGTLLLLIREGFFNDIYEPLTLEGGESVFIVSRDGTIVSSYNHELLGKKITSAYLTDVFSGSKKYITMKLQKENYYVVYANSRFTNWAIVTLMPERSIRQRFSSTRAVLISVIVLYFLFFLFISYLISRTLTKPLKNVVSVIEKIGNGDLDARIGYSQSDEIGLLGKTVNSMAEKITTLLSRVTEEEKLKNQAELKALQMQLSPHFLYNTLNTIKWMAVINKQENIKRMIQALIKLMRNISNTQTVLVPLSQELELIRSYVYIQKMRYSSFTLTEEVPAALLNCRINKFILQSVVENSIIHGFSAMDGGGEVAINARKEGDSLYILVRDNGKGFNVAAMEEQMNTWDDEHNHTGLISVRNRIKLNHGEQYGLTIRSAAGQGTEVEFHLPFIEGEDAPDV